MPKAKVVHKSFKLTPGKSKISLNFVILATIAAVLLVGGYFYSTMQTVTINEIRNSGGASLAIPTPTAAPRDCEKVSTFSLSGSCELNSYQTVSFTCGNLKEIQTQGGKNSCKSVAIWYNAALSTCLSKCPRPSMTPTPTPKPSMSATPKPSPTPIRRGDLNSDGYINQTDVNILKSQMGQKGSNLSGDLNRDGSVSIIDYNILLTLLDPTP